MDPKTKKILIGMAAVLVLHDLALSTQRYALKKLIKSQKEMGDVVNQNAVIVNDLVECHNQAVVNREFGNIVDRFDD